MSWNQVLRKDWTPFYSICFTDKNQGYAVGGGGTIEKTEDGGINWTDISDTTLQGTLRSVFFVDANTGYAVGVGGTILKTEDAGSTWVALASGTSNHLAAAFFTDSKTGYVVGDQGTILKTTNGGTGVFERSKVQNQPVIIYPNPAENVITVELKGYQNIQQGSITILNLAGQVLVDQLFKTPRSEINIGSFQPGIYFVQVRYEHGIGMGKFIKAE